MRQILALILVGILVGCNTPKTQMQKMAAFKGQQVTGVTVSEEGRLFANFPRWRENVQHSVVEVHKDQTSHPFPNQKWNSWNLGDPPSDSIFIAVQSVVTFENTLFVLDTRNPLFAGVIDSPRIFAFDLTTQTLKRTYVLTEDSFHKDSYINDLRVDKKQGKIYLTDSGHAGLVVVDVESGQSLRVLDNHESTRAETDHLNFSNGIWKNTVHSDGIALDTQNDVLYFHALTGYHLYAISTSILSTGNASEIESAVRQVAKTPAPDGMIIDPFGNLLLADLENNKIMKFTPSNGQMSVFAEGEEIKWADTFSMYGNDLYFTNSRINEANEDISEMEFSIYKIPLN